jgi:hypothetical protein
VILADPATGQRICVASMPDLKNAAIGLESNDLERTLSKLEARGGVVSSRWSFPRMIGANARDGDGHELVIWQSLAQRGRDKK